MTITAKQAFESLKVNNEIYDSYKKLRVFELQKRLEDELTDDKASDETKKRIEVLQNLIKEKQDEQRKLFNNTTLSPLLEAFLAEHFPDIKSIYERRKFPVNEYDEDSESDPFKLAIKNNNLDLIKEIIKLTDNNIERLVNDRFSMFYSLENTKILEYILLAIPEPLKQKRFILNLFTKLDSYELSTLMQVAELEETRKYLFQLFEKHLTDVDLFPTIVQQDCFFMFTTFVQLIKIPYNIINKNISALEEWGNLLAINIKEESVAKASKEVIQAAKEKLTHLMSTLAGLYISERTQHNLLNNKIGERRDLLSIKLIKKIYYSLPIEYAQKLDNFHLTQTDCQSLLDNLEIKSFKEWISFILEIGGIYTQTKESSDSHLYNQASYEALLEYCIKTKNADGIKLLRSYKKNFVQQQLKISLFSEVKQLEERIGVIHKLNDLKDKKEKLEIVSDAQIVEHQKNICLVKEILLEQLSEQDLSKIHQVLNRDADVQNKDKKEVEEKLIADIDASLFAHLHNDADLGGTILQGNRFSNTLAYLNKFLTESIADRWQISDQSEVIKKEYLSYLMQIQKQVIPAIRVAIKTENLMPETQIELARLPQEVVNETANVLLKALFEQRGNMLFPGGWRGCNGMPGHAMLYEFRVDQHNQLFFIIHNSGSGIQFHQQKKTEKNVLYSSLMHFKAPFLANDLQKNTEQLKSFLRALAEPRIAPAYGKKGYNDRIIYEMLLGNLLKLGFIQQDIHAVVKSLPWIKGQRSGTCAWKVISAYIKNFPHQENTYYKNIHFEIKRFSLHEYMQVVQKKIPDSTIIHQLHFAIQNLARLISKLGVKSQFLSKERQEKTFQYLEKVEQWLNKHAFDAAGLKVDLPQYQQNLVQNKKSLIPFSNDKFPSFENLAGNLDIRAMDTKLNAESRLLPPIYSQFSESNTLDKQVAELYNSSLKNYERNYFACLINEIDEFYLSVDKLALNQFSKSTLKTMLEQIAHLNALYASACVKQDSKTFAEHMISLVKGAMIAKAMIETYFADSASKLTILKILFLHFFKLMSEYFTDFIH